MPFLTENKNLKSQKNVIDLHDKSEYAIHVTNLKEALNHRLVLKKVHWVINFNKKTWLRPYIDINTKLRKKSKN